MDPDMVRQQEEAERAMAGISPKKPAYGTAAVSLEPQAAVPVETPAAMADVSETPPDIAYEAEAPVAMAAVSEAAPVAKAPEAAAPLREEPAAPAQKAANPNRRALPPMGTGRRPGEEPPKRRRLRGMLRLLVYILVGALIGAGVGYAAVRYLGVSPDQAQLYIGGSAGGLALISMLIGLLHYDPH